MFKTCSTKKTHKIVLWLPWSVEFQLLSVPLSERCKRYLFYFQGKAYHRKVQSSVLRSVERKLRFQCWLLDGFYQLALGCRKSWRSRYVFTCNADSSTSQKRQLSLINTQSGFSVAVTFALQEVLATNRTFKLFPSNSTGSDHTA